MNKNYSRRKFVGGMAAAVACLGVPPGSALWAQTRGVGIAVAPDRDGADNYDALARLASNENPYGPSEAVLDAMAEATKYANRYRYPDAGIIQGIAGHHGVSHDQVLLGTGSTEILHVAAAAFLRDGRKVVGVEPTFSSVYEFATGFRGSALRLPLGSDHRQDIDALVNAVRSNHPQVGLVYVCNPNNPTGVIVTKREIAQLLDGIPEDVPVLIDEAYHHYVENSNYETSVPHVIQNRPVVVARTFSKIYGLAGMRLGYAIAPAALIRRMRPHTDGMGVNALVKWGGAAALKDVAAQERVRTATLQLRRKTTAALDAKGYRVIPSEANFFMVHIRRPVMSVIPDFRQRGVLVGRPFPPMLDYLRVSIGTDSEMDRFMAAFNQILGS